jgi:hypothetical protein
MQCQLTPGTRSVVLFNFISKTMLTKASHPTKEVSRYVNAAKPFSHASFAQALSRLTKTVKTLNSLTFDFNSTS